MCNVCDRRCRGQNRCNPPWIRIQYENKFHLSYCIRYSWKIAPVLTSTAPIAYVVHSWISMFLLSKMLRWVSPRLPHELYDCSNGFTFINNGIQRVFCSPQRFSCEIRPSLRDFFHCTNCSKIANFCINKVSKITSLEVTTRRADHTYIVIDYAWCICAFNFVVGFILRRLQL